MVSMLIAALLQSGSLLQTSGTWSVSASGITGLYDIYGNQTTSAVNLTGMSYTPVYGSYMSTPPETAHFGLYNNMWQTTIKFTFSNTNWQTAPSTTVIGVQIANCRPEFPVVSGMAVPVQAWLYTVPGTPTAPYFSSTGGYLTYKTPGGASTPIYPEALSLSSFSVDPSDITGKTATMTWNCTPPLGNPYPWTAVPSAVTNLVSQFGYLPVIWVFPSMTAPGFSNGPVIMSYPVNAGGGGA